MGDEVGCQNPREAGEKCELARVAAALWRGPPSLGRPHWAATPGGRLWLVMAESAVSLPNIRQC